MYWHACDRGFVRGLSETGYVEGQNVAIEYRWADGAIRSAARDGSRSGSPPGHRDRRDRRQSCGAGSQGGDHDHSDRVRDRQSTRSGVGLVASLNRPGGNVTGVDLLPRTLARKRLELLHELVPAAYRHAVLVNPTIPDADRRCETLQRRRAARAASCMSCKPVPSATSSGFCELGATASGGARDRQPILLFNSRSEQLAALAARHAMPAIYQVREFVAAGGLMSYGQPQRCLSAGRRLYVGRILKGEKPADLPVQQPTKFELVINLKTAKALGLDVPPTLLARADEVIE